MLPVVLPLWTAAQKAAPYKGEVSVEIAAGEKFGAEVRFRANIDFSRLKLPSQTMLTLTPVVRSGSHEVKYPPVIIMTPQRERVNNRDERSGIQVWETQPSEVIVLKKKTPRWTEVSFTVPYEDWLSQAELVLVETASKGDNTLREYAPGVFSHIYTKKNNVVTTGYTAARVQRAPVTTGNSNVTPATTSMSTHVTPATTSRSSNVTPATTYRNSNITPTATAYRPQFRVSDRTVAAGQTHKESYRITFGQKNTLINRTIGDNAVVLAQSDQKIREILTTPGMEITAITMTGYASPEGEMDDNGTLAADRVQTLVNYLSNVHNLRSPAVKVQTSGDGEDWSGLRKLVENSTLDNRYRILDVLDNYTNINERKNAMKELDGGASYAVLLNYFSALRRVEYTIEYSTNSSSSQSGFKHAVEQLEAGAYEESIRYFGQQTGAEAWNNLGIAYWHTGDYGRSLDYFNRAADAGSAEAQENIRQFTRWKEN
jgi:OmpA family./Tetratricopeptide repeat.